MFDVYALLYHLKNCPEAFLQPPLTSSGGVVHTNALLADLYRKIYGNVTVSEKVLPKQHDLKILDENHIISIQIACWFFSHDCFKNNAMLLRLIDLFLFEELAAACKYVKYRQWIEDEDRAEEFVRLALWCCEQLPQGETLEQASDKFDALSTIKRQEVLKGSNASMERIKKIRQRMEEEKAREAANPYSRE